MIKSHVGTHVPSVKYFLSKVNIDSKESSLSLTTAKRSGDWNPVTWKVLEKGDKVLLAAVGLDEEERPKLPGVSIEPRLCQSQAPHPVTAGAGKLQGQDGGLPSAPPSPAAIPSQGALRFARKRHCFLGSPTVSRARPDPAGPKASNPNLS